MHLMLTQGKFAIAKAQRPMSNSLKVYFGLLLIVVSCWLWLRAPDIASFGRETQWAGLLGITLLYLGSHILRILRLVLLTLDDRGKAFPLSAAHTLTAFPSSFLPFKLGEILRLASFFHVFGKRQKALAVWLAERFGDVVVISTFILGLYIFDVQVVPAMRTVFVLFVLASGLSLLGFFAVAKVFVYLNRHLVLTSHTPRGLTLLLYVRVMCFVGLKSRSIGRSRDVFPRFYCSRYLSGLSRSSHCLCLSTCSGSGIRTSLHSSRPGCWRVYRAAVGYRMLSVSISRLGWWH